MPPVALRSRQTDAKNFKVKTPARMIPFLINPISRALVIGIPIRRENAFIMDDIPAWQAPDVRT